MKWPAPFCLLLVPALAACGDFPRDPHGTLDQVREEKLFKVGLVAPLSEGELEGAAGALLEGVSRAAGAEPSFEQGDMETLLHRLEEGEIELVLGRFEVKSPWAKMVTFGPTLRQETHGKTRFHLAPAMRNGENAWVALIEKAARDVAPEAQ